MTIDQRILNALKRRDMLTRELAEACNEDNRKVYSRCRKLEKLSSIKSEIVREKRLLYCVDDKVVVTREIYDICREEGHELRFFYLKERLWSIA